MTVSWYDWIAARVAEQGGVLTFDDSTPDLGLTPWILSPVAEETQEHWHGSQTYRQGYLLEAFFSMGSEMPSEIAAMKVVVRALSMAIESGQGRPSAVEAIEIGRISYQRNPESAGFVVSIPISIITTEGA